MATGTMSLGDYLQSYYGTYGSSGTPATGDGEASNPGTPAGPWAGQPAPNTMTPAQQQALYYKTFSPNTGADPTQGGTNPNGSSYDPNTGQVTYNQADNGFMASAGNDILKFAGLAAGAYGAGNLAFGASGAGASTGGITGPGADVTSGMNAGNLASATAPVATGSSSGGLFDWIHNGVSNLSNGVSNLFGGSGTASTGLNTAGGGIFGPGADLSSGMNAGNALTGATSGAGYFSSLTGGGRSLLGQGPMSLGNIGTDLLQYGLGKSNVDAFGKAVANSNTQGAAPINQPQRTPFQGMALNLLSNPSQYFNSNPYATSALAAGQKMIDANVAKSGNANNVFATQIPQVLSAVGGNYNDLANTLMGYGGFSQGAGNNSQASIAGGALNAGLQTSQYQGLANFLSQNTKPTQQDTSGMTTNPFNTIKAVQ